MTIETIAFAWLTTGILLASMLIAGENVIPSGETHPWRARLRMARQYIRHHRKLLALAVISGLSGWVMLGLGGLLALAIARIGNNGGFES